MGPCFAKPVALYRSLSSCDAFQNRLLQIRNAKGVFWKIVSVDQLGTPLIQRRRASNKRATSKSMPTKPGMSRSVSGVPVFIYPRAGLGGIAPQMNRARSNRVIPGFFRSPEKRQTLTRAHGKFVSRLTTKNYSFVSTPFRRFPN